MRFSLRFNNDLPVKRFARLAALAEENGFDQIWCSHDLFWQSAPVVLAAAAEATSRITLGAGVMNPVSMHVTEIAMAAASLQELSQGRFRLGIGAGADRFLAWARIQPEPAAARTRHAVLALRRLFAGEVPEGWAADGWLRIAPVDVPIYVGAMGPRMLELAGELADGALPLLFPPEQYARAVDQISTGARRAGRDLSEIDVAACVWCSIDPDPAKALRAMARKLAYYGSSFSPDLLQRAQISLEDFKPIESALSRRDLEGAADMVTPRMLSLGLVGDADAIAERCSGLVAAGAEHISFGPPLGPDLETAVRTLGREVLPKLAAL